MKRKAVATTVSSNFIFFSLLPVYFIGWLMPYTPLSAQPSSCVTNINVLQSIQNGSATVTHTSFDIGGIQDVFDGNQGTLARSAAINPMVITVSFDYQVHMDSMSILQTYGDGWFTLEAAGSLADLNAQSGSYQMVLNMIPMTDGIPVNRLITLNKKVFRLSVKRTTIDNYVHLNEWKIFGTGQYQVDAISATPDSIRMHPGWELFLKNPSAFQTPLVTVQQGGNNVVINPGCIHWSVSNALILELDTATAKVKALMPGNASLVGTLGTHSFTIPVSVTRLQAAGNKDLAVRYIKRLPEINYVENSTNPTVEGWPAAGQTITWRAHIRNWSGDVYNGVGYAWKKNGIVIATGIVNVAADQEMTVALNDTWAFQRDSIEFIIDPENSIPEFNEVNNTLKMYTNAISLNLYVEQSLYDYFHVHQYKLGQSTNSWDDWAQILHVNRWNKMFQDAIFPEVPDGVLDRIRIDSIVIVPDNVLPLTRGLPSNNPNMNDKTVDLQWGFEYSADAITAYANHSSAIDNNPFFFEGSLLHELGHARYLIDTYGMDMDTAQVNVKEGNVEVAGSTLMPLIAFNVVYYNKNQGLMSGTYNHLSLYDAMALNRIAYYRATCGNMNAPCNIGTFINDLPINNFFILKDQFGNSLDHACVEVYQASPQAGTFYGKNIDDIPDLSFTTDGNGKVNMGHNPFSATNIIHEGNTTMNLVIRVEQNNKVGYKIIEASDFNIEFWKGNTNNAQYTYQVNMLNCSDFAGASCNCCAQNYWNGTVSTAWENGANWSCGQVPGPDTYVYINPGKPNYPVITSIAYCRKIVLDTATTLKVTTGYHLIVTGQE